MYRIFAINFDYFLQDSFGELSDAIAKARSTGFQCSIYRYLGKQDGEMQHEHVTSVGPFIG